ncbi:MAG: DUF16 domain-containing protein [Mycoplasmataceae bacterium]|jgi:hypothetical protein|nr:DUF16 domain-containing protein [Mycoplasmataceae bacterium]
MPIKHKIIDMTKNKELIGQEITLEKVKKQSTPKEKYLTIKTFNEFKTGNSTEIRNLEIKIMNSMQSVEMKLTNNMQDMETRLTALFLNQQAKYATIDYVDSKFNTMLKPIYKKLGIEWNDGK